MVNFIDFRVLMGRSYSKRYTSWLGEDNKRIVARNISVCMFLLSLMSKLQCQTAKMHQSHQHSAEGIHVVQVNSINLPVCWVSSTLSFYLPVKLSWQFSLIVIYPVARPWISLPVSLLQNVLVQISSRGLPCLPNIFWTTNATKKKFYKKIWGIKLSK